MSRWGELIPHREDDESCLCGCQDDILTAEGEPPVDEYRLSTRGEHDFVYDDDHVQRCTRCRHPHSQWAGGPCPGVPQDWKPGSYI